MCTNHRYKTSFYIYGTNAALIYVMLAGIAYLVELGITGSHGITDFLGITNFSKTFEEMVAFVQ